MLREVAIGSTRRRNTFVSEQEAPLLIEEARMKNLEGYWSVFLYGTEFEEYLKTSSTSRIKGYRGVVYPPDLIIVDIDKGSNTGDATVDKFRKTLSIALEDLKVENIYVYPYFSGSGFHIGFPSSLFGFNAGQHLPEIVKATFKSVFPLCDVSYITHTGLIRAANTINLKTLKYKIPLTVSEALSLSYEQVLQEASLPRLWDHKLILSSPTLEHLKTEEVAHARVHSPQVEAEATSNLVMCMQKLFLEGGVEGQRHKKLPALVSSWRLGGLPLEAVHVLARQWAPTMDHQELHDIVNYAWEKGYTFSCEHEIMTQYCDRRCAYFARKDAGMVTQKATELGESLRKRMASNWEGREFYLQNLFPGEYNFRVRTGDMIEIIGDAGLGKTAFIISLLTALKWKTLYFNLEMKSETVYRRFLQNLYDLTELGVYEQYAARYAEFDAELDWLSIVNDPPDSMMLEKLIAVHQPKIVVFDTFDDIPTKGVIDPTSRTEHAARAIRRLTDKFDLVAVCIHHITKNAVVDGETGRRKALTIHSGKGSSALEQKSDIVLMLEGNEKDELRTLKSGKTRDTDPLDLCFKYDKAFLKYRATQERPPSKAPLKVTNGTRLAKNNGGNSGTDAGGFRDPDSPI